MSPFHGEFIYTFESSHSVNIYESHAYLLLLIAIIVVHDFSLLLAFPFSLLPIAPPLPQPKSICPMLPALRRRDVPSTTRPLKVSMMGFPQTPYVALGPFLSEALNPFGAHDKRESTAVAR